MYSNSDFESFFICYKSEAMTNKESIQSFCLRNKVPYNLFEKWYKKNEEMIIRLRSKLDAMLSDVHPPRGDLMKKALSYLNTFWTPLFAYLKDGSYTIDNSIAERFIRPLSGERKNSLFFGSGKMAGVSAAYHTIISTYKIQSISVLKYFKMFFQAIVNGRRDYENLFPMTIGLGNNKL